MGQISFNPIFPLPTTPGMAAFVPYSWGKSYLGKMQLQLDQLYLKAASVGVTKDAVDALLSAELELVRGSLSLSTDDALLAVNAKLGETIPLDGRD